ncbi:hypothetical protein [Microbulbifer variabilis]|uniref:hypothetical protein n=1 Tax=Microbulbifer variabilis TaxID=266805 RepID=UPI001CFD1EEF|nr:hypothetical protein [Microbulbifer variabilis]
MPIFFYISDQKNFIQQLTVLFILEFRLCFSEKIKDLLPFVGGERLNMPKGLPFHLDHHLELADWSGRHLDSRKRGCICENTPPILEDLVSQPSTDYISTGVLKAALEAWGNQRGAVQQACNQLNKRWVHGLGDCRCFLQATPLLI